jgi:CBS domain-containing protein
MTGSRNFDILAAPARPPAAARGKSDIITSRGTIMIITSVEPIIRNQRVITVLPSATVRSVADTLARYDIGAVLVVEDDKLLGIFTERDAVTRIIAEGRDAEATRVAEVMTADPSTVGSDCSLVKAVEIMASRGFRHLPVVDGGRIAGVLSMRDVPLHYRLLYENWVSTKTGGAAAAVSA